MNTHRPVPDRNLAIELVRTTEAAAIAAAPWQGRGQKEDGDQAAVDAMRHTLSTVNMDGVVVIGEGEKDEAPMLFNGEHVGNGDDPQVDIAVDPIDGTRLLAEGRQGSLAVIAAATRGTMFDPGPIVYMEKIVVGSAAKDVIDLDAPVKDNLAAVANATGKGIRDLGVMILDRPRHTELIREIREAGARIQLIMDGDVAAGVLAAWNKKQAVDIAWGIGGTPEGVTTACAVRALGGEILGRLWPRDDDERKLAAEGGYDVTQILTANDLVSTQDCFFACTGVTPGQLLEGVTYTGSGATTQSLVMRGKSGTVRVIKAEHRTTKIDQITDY